jgi:phenylalanyl-tRNA synthetase beta subunit
MLAVQVAELLSRMALAGEVVGDGSVVRVSVPPTRSDVLHACDVAEVQRTACCRRMLADLLADGSMIACFIVSCWICNVTVLRPGTRGSINAEAADVWLQDVAIAYGYNNIGRTIPQAVTIGRELPMNQLTELLRGELAAAGCAQHVVESDEPSTMTPKLI